MLSTLQRDALFALPDKHIQASYMQRAKTFGKWVPGERVGKRKEGKAKVCISPHLSYSPIDSDFTKFCRCTHTYQSSVSLISNSLFPLLFPAPYPFSVNFISNDADSNHSNDCCFINYNLIIYLF